MFSLNLTSLGDDGDNLRLFNVAWLEWEDAGGEWSIGSEVYFASFEQ